MFLSGNIQAQDNDSHFLDLAVYPSMKKDEYLQLIK
jgi:hypothetical protein